MTQTSRKPDTFWDLTFDDELVGYRNVIAEAFDLEVFDCTRLWNGIPFDGDFPPDAKLYLPPGQEPIADNIFSIQTSWLMFSDRLVEHLWPIIKGCVQVFPAPLYELGSDRRVSGWQVLNVTKVLDCVDVERSTPWRDIYDKDKIGGFYDVCIDPRRTEGVHMFKYVIPPGEVYTGVICSYELVKSLEYKGFTGLAFIRCQCKDEM